jgi:hypothetical protein
MRRLMFAGILFSVPTRPMTPLDRALENGPYQPLPADVTKLLVELAAPPRLVAHLRLVHDAAARLADGFGERWPGISVNRSEVLFGAATHDIGKVRFPGELTGPGSRHEEAGYQMLCGNGFDAKMARFARDHARWNDSAGLEDLLVTLADKIWKGKRVEELEDVLVSRIAQRTGVARWQAFVALDAVIAPIVAGAEARLAFQAAHPVS